MGQCPDLRDIHVQPKPLGLVNVNVGLEELSVPHMHRMHYPGENAAVNWRSKLNRRKTLAEQIQAVHGLAAGTTNGGHSRDRISDVATWLGRLVRHTCTAVLTITARVQGGVIFHIQQGQIAGLLQFPVHPNSHNREHVIGCTRFCTIQFADSHPKLQHLDL